MKKIFILGYVITRPNSFGQASFLVKLDDDYYATWSPYPSSDSAQIYPTYDSAVKDMKKLDRNKCNKIYARSYQWKIYRISYKLDDAQREPRIMSHRNRA